MTVLEAHRSLWTYVCKMGKGNAEAIQAIDALKRRWISAMLMDVPLSLRQFLYEDYCGCFLCLAYKRNSRSVPAEAGKTPYPVCWREGIDDDTGDLGEGKPVYTSCPDCPLKTCTGLLKSPFSRVMDGELEAAEEIRDVPLEEGGFMGMEVEDALEYVMNLDR